MIRLGSDRIMERNVLKKKKVYQIFCPPKGDTMKKPPNAG
jgi:hypothetical protein